MERVELKRDWPSNRDLAHDCCAMANGLGGAIIVGYEDKSVGGARFPGVDGSGKRIDAALASVHSLTWPSVRCIMHPYQEAGGTHTCVVVVVPPTEVGPHEYIGGGKSNLPVRRGRSNRSLSLTEIFALQRQAESFASKAPDIGYPIIALNTQKGTYWGVAFYPTEWPEERLVFGRDEDLDFAGYWGRRWRPDLVLRENGIELSYNESDLNFSVAIHVDGSVVMLWHANHRRWMYYVAFLEECYDFASFVFYKLGFSPRATMRVQWAVAPDDPKNDKEPFPTFGQLARRVDFSRDAIDDVLTFVIEQTHRLGGRSQPRERILNDIRTRGSVAPPDPRERWGTR
jgi:hypothetical protein